MGLFISAVTLSAMISLYLLGLDAGNSLIYGVVLGNIVSLVLIAFFSSKK